MARLFSYSSLNQGVDPFAKTQQHVDKGWFDWLGDLERVWSGVEGLVGPQ
jgi:hypothetical protein